jgi:hypothetical protein
MAANIKAQEINSDFKNGRIRSALLEAIIAKVV